MPSATIRGSLPGRSAHRGGRADAVATPRPADRAVGGLRRPGGPADRALAVLRELLRDERRTVGRPRLAIHRPRRERDRRGWMDADPSMDAIDGAFTAAINHYLRRSWSTPPTCPMSDLRRVQPWSYAELRSSRRPRCWSGPCGRILTAHVSLRHRRRGHPPAAAEQVLAPLRPPDSLRGEYRGLLRRRAHDVCPRGVPARQSADLADFVARASRIGD